MLIASQFVFRQHLTPIMYDVVCECVFQKMVVGHPLYTFTSPFFFWKIYENLWLKCVWGLFSIIKYLLEIISFKTHVFYIAEFALEK